ncbi:glycosyltransferase family 4 protein [Caulobacter sp.]|uniref:glycosyltransferase family 4 protein n=1 Tax=Caulobacter sp. TaxID=78 RepID=UPI003BABE4CD
MPSPNRKPTVWILARGYTPDEGGLETYGRAVGHAYAAAGWKVVVFAPTSAGPRRFHDGAVEVVDVGAASQPVVMARLVAALRRELKGGRPDFTHAITWRLSIPGEALGLKPLAISVHGREINFVKGPMKALMALLMRRAQFLVAVSHFTKQMLAERVPSAASKTIVAWNGLSDWAENLPNRVRPVHSPTRLLSLCRLVERKNIAGAVQAAADCTKAGAAPFLYEIGGRGPQTAEINRRIEAGSAAEQVKMLGFVPDDAMPGLFLDADIFLHPQIATEGGKDVEGFGIVIADAMAAGCACIVGKAGGPAELIIDGETGFVVDGDDTAAIRARLSQLLADPEACARLGRAAQVFARDHFSWRKHVNDILAGAGLSGSGGNA